jgi:RNA polymerase subunit RPABC4/transcription elongation factor Spt4
MSSVRPGNLGATRVCPHCKATVLENSAVCPGCRHHLRFNTGTAVVTDDNYSALDVEGTIRHRVATEPCEYCVVLDVRNERGEQVVRQVVGVGVLQPGQSRRLHVAVDMLPVSVRTPAAASKTAPPPSPPSATTTAPAAAQGPAPAPASPAAAAKSFLKPPVPGQTPATPAAKPGQNAPGLFRGFRKP